MINGIKAKVKYMFYKIGKITDITNENYGFVIDVFEKEIPVYLYPFFFRYLKYRFVRIKCGNYYFDLPSNKLNLNEKINFCDVLVKYKICKNKIKIKDISW